MFKRKVIFSLLLVASVLISYSELFAVTAAPIIHTMTQPDGTTFNARLWGDENSSGLETEDGYSIVFDETINRWTYAIYDADGNMTSSSMVIGIDSPPGGVPQRIRPTGQNMPKMMLTREKRSNDNELQATFADIMDVSELQGVVPPTGIGNIPVILINFNNRTVTYAPADFNTLLLVLEITV